MAKALKTIGTVVAVVGLVATGVGAIAAAGTALAATAGTIGTIATVAGGAIGIASSVLAKPPKFSTSGNPLRFQTNPQSSLPYNVGRTRFSGIRIHAETARSSGSKNEDILSFGVLLSAGGEIEQIESFKADKIAYTFDGSGQATGAYSGFMALRNSLGSPGASALALSLRGSAVPGWTAAHKLSGMAHALWQLGFDSDGEKYTAGAPQPEWIGKWTKVYDPRKDDTYPGGAGNHRALNESTYEWSRNGALIALTYALGRYQNGIRTIGIGAAVANIRVSDFVEAANIADVNQWYCGGTIYSGDSKWNTLKAMLQAAGAVPTKTGAMIGCRVFTPRVPVVTIEAKDLLDSFRISTTKSRTSRKNTVIPRYRSEAHEWGVISGTPVSEPAFVTQDGGTRSEEYDLPLVQHEVGQAGVDGNRQAGQLAAYKIVNSREAGPIFGTVGIAFLGLKTNDAVTLNVPDEGIDNQLIILGEASLDPSTGKTSFVAETETTTKHPYALGETTTPPTGFALDPGDLRPDAPDDQIWSIASGTLSEGQPAVILTGANEDVGTNTLLVRVKKSADSDWPAATVLDAFGGTITHDIGPLESLTSYDVEIAYKSADGQSDWTALGPVTTTAYSIDLAAIDNLEYLTGSDAIAGVANLFSNGDFSKVNLDANPIRPLGVKVVSGSTTLTNQPRYPGADPATKEMYLGEGLTASLRAYFPLWRCNPKALYIATFEARADSAVAAGHYARFMELDIELTKPGATHMGYTPAHSDPTIQNATRERNVGGEGSIENDALTATYQTFSIQIKPSATAKYMGFELLRWGTAPIDPGVTPAQRVPFRWRNLRIVEVSPQTLADLDTDQDGKLSAIEIGATRNQETNNLIPNAQTYDGSVAPTPASMFLENFTPAANAIRNWRRVRANSNGGAQSFWIYGNTIAEFVPVREGETLYKSFEAYRNAANGSAYLNLAFYRGDGSFITSLSGAGATATATVNTWLNYNEEVTVPAGAAYMLARFLTLADNTTNIWYFASPYIGRSQLGSDVTAEAVPSQDGPSAVTITADHLGVVDPGQLPKTLTFIRKKGDVNVTTTSVWSIESEMNCTASIGASSGAASLTDITGSGSFVVVSLRDGVTIKTTVIVTMQKSQVPDTGSGGGSGTTVNDSSFVSTASASPVQISDTMTVSTGANGQIDFAAPLTINTAAASPEGSWGASLQWEYRLPGGSWSSSGITAAIETSQTNTVFEAEGGFYESFSGNIAANRTKTGLTADTDYEVRLLGNRRTGVSKTIFFSGTASATGS